MIIAHTPLTSRVDIDSGFRYNEWQIRSIGLKALQDNPILREQASLGQFMVERRHVRTDTQGPTVVGAWEVMAYGPSPAEALETAWESQLDTAESVHEVHARVWAYVQALRERIAAASMALDAVTGELSRLAAALQQRYEAELKNARLFAAAQRGRADPEKVKAIRQPLSDEFLARKTQLLERQRQAEVDLAAARAVTFAQWDKQRRSGREPLNFVLVPARRT